MTVGSQVRTCFASIKSIHAELDQLAMKTNEKETRQQLEQANKIIAEIKEDLSMQMIKLKNEEPQYK